MKKMGLPSFIDKVWDILHNPEYEKVMRWTSNGLSFQICSERFFCKDVLPKFFKHSNISSFIRQLNMYNFRKKRNKSTHLQFYHQLFRRENEQLLVGIKRKPNQADLRFAQQLVQKHQHIVKFSCLDDVLNTWNPDNLQECDTGNSHKPQDQCCPRNRRTSLEPIAMCQPRRIPNIILVFPALNRA